MGKSVVGSRTVWANVGLGIIAVLGANVPALSFLNAPEVITGVTIGVNLLLRFLTKEPITSVVPK